jgi:hypothetical protein
MRTIHLVSVVFGIASMLVASVLNSIDGMNSARPSERHLHSLLALIPGACCLFGLLLPRRPSERLITIQFALSTPVTMASVLVGCWVAEEWLRQKGIYGSFIGGTYCWFFVMLPCGALSFTLGLAVRADERMRRDRGGHRE